MLPHPPPSSHKRANILLNNSFGLEAWISILVTHIYFVRARRAQGIDDTQMPFVAPLGLGGSVGALISCVIIAIFKNFAVFTKSDVGSWDFRSFITGYIGLPVYLILIFGHKLWKRQGGVKPHEADFFTGKEKIDREEKLFIEFEANKGPGTGFTKFYRQYVSWLF